MEYENFDSHLDEFDSSDEHIPSDSDVDSFLDYENDIPEPDPFEESDMDAEIRRIHMDAFPFDDI